MELIRFRVLTKVEQINDNLFLNTCKNESLFIRVGSVNFATVQTSM